MKKLVVVLVLLLVAACGGDDRETTCDECMAKYDEALEPYRKCLQSTTTDDLRCREFHANTIAKADADLARCQENYCATE